MNAAGVATAWRRKHERGFSLIEVMIALAVFSAVLIPLAQLSFHAAVASRFSAGVAHRSAAMNELVGRLSTMPLDSLDGEVGCEVVKDPGFWYEWCVSVYKSSKNERLVQVVITPADDEVRPDTFDLRRSKVTGGGLFKK